MGGQTLIAQFYFIFNPFRGRRTPLIIVQGASDASSVSITVFGNYMSKVSLTELRLPEQEVKTRFFQQIYFEEKREFSRFLCVVVAPPQTQKSTFYGFSVISALKLHPISQYYSTLKWKNGAMCTIFVQVNSLIRVALFLAFR